MLNDEKKIIEEELEKVQESYSNSETQLSLLSQEIETQKTKNDIIVSENHELKTKIRQVELENNSLQARLDNITKNVSNFNKGRENLSKILENSQSSSSKHGLGYKKESKIPKKKNTNLKRNMDSKQQILLKKPIKTKVETKVVKIWVPKTNNVLIRNQYIKTFMDNVHHNENFIYKKDTKPNWVWFPKL